MKTDEHVITISDAKCRECGGVLTAFVIPNKVWQGLHLDGWVCMTCIARRIDPSVKFADADILSELIYSHRRRFGLKKVNAYLGLWVPRTGVIECHAAEGTDAAQPLAAMS